MLKVTERARARRPRAARPLPLAYARDLGRRRRRRGEAVGLRSRHPRGPGALRADRAPGRGRAATPTRPASTTSNPRLDREPLVSIVIPTAGQSREVRYEAGRAGRALRAQHRRDLDLRELRDRLRGRRRRSAHATRSTLRRDRRRPAAARRVRRAVQLLGKDQPRRRPQQRASTCCSSTTTWRSITPDWLERLVMYAELPGVGAVGGTPPLGGRAPPARRHPLRERRLPRPHLPRLRRRLRRLLEQRPGRPELPRA